MKPRQKTLLAQIKDGADFEELAKTHSLYIGSAADGGDLGWFPRGVMVTELEDAAFALEPGQVSDVVATDYGYHIIKVLEKEVWPLDETYGPKRRPRTRPSSPGSTSSSSPPPIS